MTKAIEGLGKRPLQGLGMGSLIPSRNKNRTSPTPSGDVLVVQGISV